MKTLKNIKQLVTLKEASEKDGRNLKPEDLSVLEDASIVVDQGKINWVGKTKDLPWEYSSKESHDCSDLVVTPEIVDSHTHLVFGGNRAFEYSMRLNGASYEEIAQAGGGILATMKNTIAESEQVLYEKACERIERMRAYGVGTIEIKSGYALESRKEKEISKMIQRLKDKYAGEVQIFNTFLAAHAVPQNYKTSSAYLNDMVIPLMEELNREGVIDAVDIFHEVGYFDSQDANKLFKRAKELGLPVKSHADEFNDNDGAALACGHGALSCDHLLKTSKKGVKKLSSSPTVATLLPGTAFFLGKELPNARAFLDSGCKVAIASDYNPGSCHCDNLLLIASLAGKNLQMNMAQLWSAITLNSAAALGMSNQGSIEVGKKARFSFFKCESVDEIIYSWGRNFAVTPEEVFDR